MGTSRRTLVLAAACAVVAAAAAVMAVWDDGDGVSEIGQPDPAGEATATVWSIDDLPGDILNPASDASGGGETVQASLEREQEEFVACLARAGFPGYPQRPVFPTLPRTRGEMLERRAGQGYGLSSTTTTRWTTTAQSRSTWRLLVAGFRSFARPMATITKAAFHRGVLRRRVRPSSDQSAIRSFARA